MTADVMQLFVYRQDRFIALKLFCQGSAVYGDKGGDFNHQG